MYFRKKYIEKYDLQESYNNFKIKLKISFVNRALVRCIILLSIKFNGTDLCVQDSTAIFKTKMLIPCLKSVMLYF